MPPAGQAGRVGDQAMQAGNCKHYCGTMGNAKGEKGCCNAGVNLRQHVGGEDTGWVIRLPCLKTNRDEPRCGPVVPCSLYTEPTPEEIATDQAEWKEMFERAEKLFPLMNDLKKKHRKTGGSGVMECPQCGKVALNWRVSSYNGHVWLQCQTPDCVCIIE